MNPIEETLLFQSIAPYVDCISRDELLYELLKANTTVDVKWDKPTIDAAFNWMKTPQGSQFWSELYEEVVLNIG